MKSDTSTLTANCFGRNGTIVKNPNFLIYRQEKQQAIFGEFHVSGTPQEILEWLVMDGEGIPFGKVAAWCRKHNPRLCIFNVKRNEEYVYSYRDNKQIGVQMFLFDMKGIQ